MMPGVWSDSMIRDAGRNGLVTPYYQDHINPASIDLTLSPDWIDLRRDEAHNSMTIHIEPGDAILASTVEFVRIPTNAAAIVLLKSSLARKGLDHALAGWIDPGFHGNLTLELHAHRPITLTAGQRIVQMVLFTMAMVPNRDYAETGRYQNQTGPTVSRG